MKVYIDEKDIGTTITYKEENGKKQYLYAHDKEGFELKDIADYTKQVRKEVCDEIKKWCDKNFNWVGDGTGYDGQDYNEMIGSNNTINKLREFLDQIQGE